MPKMPAGREGSIAGGILTHRYARAQVLEPWLGLVAVRGEVIVQFWLKPGAAAVTLGTGGAAGGEDTGHRSGGFYSALPMKVPRAWAHESD